MKNLNEESMGWRVAGAARTAAAAKERVRSIDARLEWENVVFTTTELQRSEEKSIHGIAAMFYNTTVYSIIDVFQCVLL